MPKTSSNTKVTGSRKLSPEEYRVLAEHAETKQAEQRRQDRKDRARRAVGVPAKQWATEQHVKIAQQHDKAHRREQAKKQPATLRPDRDELWERQRQAMIRDRNRRRRLPWYGALAAVGVGLVGHGAVALFTTTTTVPAAVPATVFAAIPAVTTAGIAVSHERRYQHRRKHSPVAVHPAHRRWAPELALGGAAAAAVTYWTALAGLSWPIVLAVLVGTIVAGWRWWKANPIGPRVAPLQPPKPKQPEPVQPAPQAAPSEDYAAQWRRYNANPQTGKAPNSVLTNRRDTEFAVKFTAELDRGGQTPAHLRTALPLLASGLGINRHQLIVEDDPAERGEHYAEVTIVTSDPVAEIRYYTGPQVTVTEQNGIVHRTGRYGDGIGELDLTMWNDAGMVPTSIIGATRSGKSCVGNIATTGVLSSGVMNLLYIDPKVMSSPDLEDIARIVILDAENAARAPELMDAIVAARQHYASKHRISKFNPTPELPGWMVLHDEFSVLVNRGYRTEAMRWTNLVNTVAAMGIWPVAMNQAMQESKWGDDQCRQAFASQMVLMRMRTKSDKLLPDIEIAPSSLPNKKGKGLYVYDGADRSNVSVQFDFTPETNEAKHHPDAPLSTSDAFHQFNQQPELLAEDYEAIVSVLGEPVNGRWVVGGANPTHAFPPKGTKPQAGTSARASSAPRRSAGGWGAAVVDAAAPSTSGDGVDGLPDSQRRVYELIQGGNTRTSDIEAASVAKRSTVHDALSALMGGNWIHRAGHGEYALGPADSAEPDQD